MILTLSSGRYEVATGIINPVTVTGVSVIMPQKIDSDRFIYNAKGGTTSDKGSVEASDGSQSVYVGVRNGTSRYVDLHEGETLNLMAFLPPVDMDADEDNNKVRIMVHTTGMDYVMSVDGNQITKQNKYFIQLPDMSPDDSNVNNWMSELDSSTPLNKLSIPAYICSEKDTGEDIKKLLAKGVRAFDLNKVCESKYSYEGDVHWNSSIADYVGEALKEFLINVANNNLKEFVVIWINNSDDYYRLNEYLDYTLDFENKWISPKNFSNTTIASLGERRLLVVKKNTGAYSGYFNNEDEKPWAVSERTNLFPYEENVTSIDASRNWWGVYFVTDTNITTSKNLYEYISSYDGQTGCTGIVTIPNAKDTYVNGQYTYSDLLIQSIIDCNFKFRH